MKIHDKEITISDIQRMFPNHVSEDLADELFIARLRASENMDFFSHPCRFDGILAYYCIKGSFTLEMNLIPIEIKEGSFVLYIPGSIVRCSDVGKLKDSEFAIVAASKRLLNDMHFDFSRMYEDSMKLMSDPCISLTRDEFSICRNYYYLTKSLLEGGHSDIRDAISSLGASVFFYLGNIWKDRISKARFEPTSSLRTKLIFENFMKLVREYHNEQHSVGFYAENLCLTPKYLSQVIKKVSGKSAPEWIDSFIIQEAKSLLKYSDCDIKEIVYKLNFNSQSVFYRFFKAQTGLTPAEYRKQ